MTGRRNGRGCAPASRLVGGGAAVLARAAKIKRIKIFAIGQVAAQTGFAVAAPHIGQHNVIACRYFLHTAADLLHHARAFMPEHDRQRHS